MTSYFEDVTVGQSETYGSHRMERDEMTAFAEQFDPQAMHVDSEAAAASGYDDVIASGIHTLAVAQRLLVDEFLAASSNRAGLGIEDLRFHDAVYPGDELSVRHEVVETRDSASHPDAGIVTSEFTVLRTGAPGSDHRPRDGDDTVLSWTGSFMMGRRTTADDGEGR